jgi:hypothetical protein
MDLITGQRTFYVGVSGLADGSVTDIPFRDSAGNDINCNYIEVSMTLAGAAATVGGFAAELSGVSHTGDMITNTLSALNSTLEGSGICGFGGVATARGLPVIKTWHGSNGQVATGIKVQVAHDANSMLLGVTYGNLFPLNTIRTTNSLIYDAGV